jgi:23S rRNA (cytidine1920-2'-O)/16S rRNA (cytidine1409-2'-O)-methyltransferase
MTHRRADITLTELGHFSSREKAKAAIIAGRVRVDGAPLEKAGQPIDADAQIKIERGPEYVSRGGSKLQGALEAFAFDPSGMRALDVGASTGGFTDCLLARGAESVAAVDVGYGQLAWKIRQDPRVAVFERANIRHADPVVLGAPFDLAVIDVSFIGLEIVMPVVAEMIDAEGSILALVKPQFEAGRERIGKHGVVRDPAVHESVLDGVRSLATDLGWRVRGLTWSPVTGPKGNIEFWVWLSRHGEETFEQSDSVVANAHRILGG